MKKNKQIKDMSIYEASDCWDEHDFTESGDVQEVRDLQFSLKKKKYIGVDLSLCITTVQNNLKSLLWEK